MIKTKKWQALVFHVTALFGLQGLSVIILDKRTLSNFEVKPAYPMNAASNLNSLCCVAHIRGQSDFFWLLAWDNLCKAQHKHIRNEWSQEHPVKIQLLGQDRGFTFLHNLIFDDILTTPSYPFKRYMYFRYALKKKKTILFGNSQKEKFPNNPVFFFATG